MNILHIIRGLTNSSGTTHIVGPLAEEQAKLGHQVSVYYVEKQREEAVTPDPALVRSRAFPVTMIDGHPGVSLPLARALARDAATFDVIHIHAVWNFPTLMGMRAARRADVPYIVAPQGSLEPWALASGSSVRQLYARRVEAPLLRQASRLQALTANEARQFRDFGLDVPAAIIPNGVSPDWLSSQHRSLADDLGLPEGSRTLLFLSRVHPKKGLDVLLRGFARAADSLRDVVLVVAGHDAGSGYRAEMQGLAHELGLDARCRFIGEVAGERKRDVLAGADAFALTSHSEGLPVAVLEAMASALPVLITPGCNLPEVSESGAGLIVAPEPGAVAAGLAELIANADAAAQRGAAGRSRVAERFTWPRIAQQTIEVYADMTRPSADTVAA